MSATNWAACPKCLRVMKEARLKALLEVEKSYGKVPAAVFIANRADALAMPAEIEDEADYTLREDYNGVGVDEDGVFRIHYTAECQRCPFKFNYDEEVPTSDG